MSPLKRPDNRLYLGRGGSGKSTIARRHAEEFDRVLLLLPDESEPAPRFYMATTHGELALAMMRADQFRVALICNGSDEMWEWGNRIGFAATDCVVVWEEAGVFMRGGRSLTGRLPYAYDLWMRGRHVGCRVFACSQRPSTVSRDCTANLARAVIFQPTEPNDLKFYRAMNIEDAAARISALNFDRHEALDWTPSGASVKRAPFP
jgi:hypothetical protein